MNLPYLKDVLVSLHKDVVVSMNGMSSSCGIDAQWAHTVEDCRGRRQAGGEPKFTDRLLGAQRIGPARFQTRTHTEQRWW
jgi:hypothetical protein